MRENITNFFILQELVHNELYKNTYIEWILTQVYVKKLSAKYCQENEIL